MKIAFCFLCRDNINQVRVWEYFFPQDTSSFAVYIHSADRRAVTQEFTRQHQIPELAPTQWAGNLYNAIRLLYARAIRDDCDKMILLSESTVPFKPFEFIHRHLAQHEKSHMCYQPHLVENNWQQNTNITQLQRFINNARRDEMFMRNIDFAHWHFNEMWTILNRKHAEMIVNDDTIIGHFANCFAWDENYPSYLLSRAGLLQDEVVNEQNTFVNWKDSTSHDHGKSPKLYTSVTPEDLTHWKSSSEHLFGRKFAPGIPYQQFLELL